MDTFPPEVILAVVERMDIRSTRNLRATNRRMHKIISSYEYSICRARIASFTLPPAGDVLSSEYRLRRPLRYGTFEMVEELERRERQCDDVLGDAARFVNFTTPPGLGPLDLAQQARMRALLRQGLMRCNQLADIAANPPCAAAAPKWYRLLGIGFYEDAMASRLSPSPSSSYYSPAGFRDVDPYTNYPARPLQRAYIRSLPLLDLAILYVCVNAMGLGYLSRAGAAVVTDPEVYERAMVFEECVLRHGTWFARAAVCGAGSDGAEEGEGAKAADARWKTMAQHIQDLGMVELENYEHGVEGTLPALKSGLLQRFKELEDLRHLHQRNHHRDGDGDDEKNDYGVPDGEDGGQAEDEGWASRFGVPYIFQLYRDMVCGPDGGKEAEDMNEDEYEPIPTLVRVDEVME
ncbi:hypothetical protein GGS23DRAFT_257775 [Durotheca rogersii]|uniref:uncharacterized protein n=1 Tax=Durotheca rogersii TaxID=419775 RepID=UPI0022200F4C|nr:uncharacterized protein GGS23DRAFT_257775 [Durotheca rogersii]KAI5859992.1 hypothetical protein GGS23DRAFT_257775 [Durotheca rogersii]